MDQLTTGGWSDEQRLAQEMLGRFGGPSFVRRAKRVEDTYEGLRTHLEQQRFENLRMVRLRLGQLRALAGSWDALVELVEPSELSDLHTLHDELRPELRLPLQPTTAPRALRAALEELREAIGLFNQRWRKLLEKLDLAEANTARDLYNRYYLLERECALGASRGARDRFRPLPPLEVAHFEQLFPTLRILT